MELKFKHTAAGLKVPKFVDGCINIYASEDVFIKPSEGRRVKTNTVFEVPKGYGLLIVPSRTMGERTTVRFGNSVVMLTEKDTDELSIVMETIMPKPIGNEMVPGYFLLNGDYKHDFQKGYLPVNTTLVQKGDCIGVGYLIKLETATISRIEKKKVQEKENENKEEP